MTSHFWACVLVAIGGGCGAVLRHLTNLATIWAWGDRMPWGTLIVNLSGCLALGFIYRLSGSHLPEPVRLALGVGLLGGLTTFSTFGVETFQRLESSAWPLALANIFANVVGGLMAVAIGFWLGSWMAESLTVASDG